MRPLNLDTFVAGDVHTYSASSLITDSAAGASSAPTARVIATSAAAGALARRLGRLVVAAQGAVRQRGQPLPPPVVLKRLPHLVRADLRAAAVTRIGPGCFRECKSLVSGAAAAWHHDDRRVRL